MLMNINFSKPQLSKIQSDRFCGNMIGKLGKEALKFAVSLAKNILPQLTKGIQ